MEKQLDLTLLVERVRALIPERDVMQMPMFGGICFMVSGNMLGCASKSGLMVRVGKDQQEEALKSPHATICSPAGRPMGGFISLAPEALETDRELKAWIDMARTYVCSLPPKKKTEKPVKTTPRRRTA
jgi:TfoX/Sxy family transcriptional regulator of competence genes